MRTGSLLAFATCSALLIGAAGLHTAAAEVYKWTDESGQVHFTQDLFQVPPRYRAAAANPEREADSKVNFVVEEKSGGDGGQRSRKLRYIILKGRHSPTRAGGASNAPKSTPPQADPEPIHRYDRRCNWRGTKCRRIQTREFREWKAREKARKEALEAASEED